ncbi:MAG: DUF899 domain-containing protein [Deltaproteobacteria bacterium]|nr:MAG: DUF899 domain-containing protein [Deltaproteobacteria bacterium]
MSGRARASRAGHRSRGSSCLSPADFGAAIRELLGLRRRATRGCPHCSFWADDFNGIPVHLNHRDVSFVAISRAPLAKIERFRRGWDGASGGSLRSRTTSIMICTWRSLRRSSRAARPRTITRRAIPACLSARGPACSTRTSAAPFFTPTPRTRAGST